MTNCYLGKNGVELKFAPGSGSAVATYSIAVPNYKKTGEKQTYTYLNCVTWNKSAEFLANNSDKIQKIGIIGRLQTRNYDAKDGTKRYVTEIVTEDIEIEEWKNTETTHNEVTPVDDGNDIPF
mgnify:FL=1